MLSEAEMRNYGRLMCSARAEQIMSAAKIPINTSLLNAMNRERPTPEKKRYFTSSDGVGYIQTKYYSRDKITARIFTVSGELNLITLSDPDIKQCIVSEHGKSGHIVELDFVGFESKIMESLTGYKFDGDVHTNIAKLLGISRDKAKLANNGFFYGMGQRKLGELLGIDGGGLFMDFMSDFISFKNKFLVDLDSQFNTNGYVTNEYGRFIYPKTSANIFNNVVQSTGSEILIDVIINIAKAGNFKLLFHRFDSLFFDMSTQELYDGLEQLKREMACNELDIKFDTSVKIGSNLNVMKKL